jgi:hypothetical protein
MNVMSINLGSRDRETLREIIQLQGTLIGEAIDRAKDAQELRRALEEAAAHLRLLNVVEGSAPANRSDTDWLIGFVSRWRNEALMDIETSTTRQREYEAGDDNWGWPSLTREQNIAEWQHQIETDHREKVACDALLAAFSSEVAA